MATAKKATEEKTVKAVAKVDVKAPAVKAETVEKKEEVKEAVKEAAPKKEATKKAPAKKAAAPKKAAAKKETAAKAPAKKAAAKSSVCIQFSDKSYTTEDLVKIAKDVWVYDLGRKESEFKSVELYVKPEENVTYYVVNGEVAGSFLI